MRSTLFAAVCAVLFSISGAHAHGSAGGPNSIYTGNANEYVAAGTQAAKGKTYARRHSAKRGGSSHRRSRVRHVQHQPKPAPITKVDLSEWGKGITSFGGVVLIDAPVWGTVFAATTVVEVVKKTLTAVGRTIEFFVKKGYSYVASAAIAGHIRAESNFNTRDVGDGGRARGLAQWHPDRQVGLKRLAAQKGTNVYDFDTNLEYIDHELRTSEGLAFRELHRARDLDDAVAAFAHFERPQGYSVRRPRRIHDWRTRLKFARQYAREYHYLQPEKRLNLAAQDF